MTFASFPRMKDRAGYFGALPLLAAIVVYLPALQGELVWDDVLLGTQISALHSWRDLLIPPAHIADWSYYYYRPVVTASYVLDRFAFGPDAAAGPHLSNVVFHVIATLLVWILAVRLLRQSVHCVVAAVFAATLFAVHPIHTESVAWIAGRSDVLATIFALGSVLCVLRWRDEGGGLLLVLGPVFFLLAMLSKENGLSAVLLAALTFVLAPSPVGYSIGSHPLRRRLLPVMGLAVGYGLVLGIYVLLRRSGAVSLDPTGGVGWLEILAKPARAVAYYIAITILPWRQSNYVVWDLVPDLPSSALILLVAGLLLIGATRRWRKRGEGVLLLGLLWFGISLAPSLLTTLTSAVDGTPVAERYLYLPSVGIALAGGALIGGLREEKLSALTISVLLSLSVGLGALTVKRSLVWHDDLSLWSDAASQARSSAMPKNWLARAYYATGDEDRALALLAEARSLDASPLIKARLHVSAGLIHTSRREFSKAESLFQDAVAIDPTNPTAYLGLGQARFSRSALLYARPESRGLLERDLDSAVQAIQKALSLRPVFTEAHVALAQIRILQGDVAYATGRESQSSRHYQAARAELDAAIAADPSAALRADFREIAARLPIRR